MKFTVTYYPIVALTISADGPSPDDAARTMEEFWRKLSNGNMPPGQMVVSSGEDQEWYDIEEEDTDAGIQELSNALLTLLKQKQLLPKPRMH